jgi:Tol biopolymer transport system component
MDVCSNKFLVITFILLFQFGCGGGGGSKDSPDIEDDHSDQNDQEETDPSTGQNGDLNGHLFIANNGKYLDLSTGLYTIFASDDPDALQTPSPDGLEYVERIRGYSRSNRCSPSIDKVKITIKDVRTNLTLDSFELYENVYGPAKLSPDGQTIALIWGSLEDCPDDDVTSLLTVFDRKGNLISQSSGSVSTFDWLPDNRLVYADNYSVFVTQQAHQVDGQIVASLADIPGFSTRLRASRDGGRIVFEMATDVPSWLETITFRDATVWMMNIDGSNLHLFATSSRENDPDDEYDDPRINNPVWSLDGNKVIVTEGFLSGIGEVGDTEYVPAGLYGTTYLLPATESEHALPPLQETNSITTLSFLESCGYQLFLVPSVEPLPEIPGSFPPQNGETHNGGILGTLYFVDDRHYDDGTVISSMNLETGQLQEVARLSSSEYQIWSMSHDAQYFAYSDYEYADDKYIRIVDSTGEAVQSIAMYTNDLDWRVNGRILFSPANSDQLLFWYEDQEKDESNNSHVALIDWRQMKIIKTFTDREYYNPLWTPDGNIMLFGNGDNKAYLANVTGDQAGNPVEQFSLPDTSLSHSISPDGTRMVFQMSRHVWTINLDGTNLKPVTAPSEGYEGYPVWSSDGRHIILKKVHNNSGVGSLYAVSSDAENIHIVHPNKNMIAVNDSEDSQLYRVKGTMMMLP